MPHHSLTTPNLTRDSPSSLTESHQESPVITDLSPHAPDNNSDDSQVYWSNIIEQMKEEKEEFRKEIHRLQNLLEAALATKGSDSAESSSSSSHTPEPTRDTPATDTPRTSFRYARRASPKVTKFQGDSSKIESATSSVNVFLADIEAVTKGFTDMEKITLAKQNMVGKARTILLMEETREISIWEEFKTLLQEEFQTDSLAKSEVIQQLRNARRRPKEQINDFCDRLRNQAAQNDISTGFFRRNKDPSQFSLLAIQAIKSALAANLPRGIGSFLHDRNQRPEEIRWRNVVATIEAELQSHPELQLTAQDIQEEPALLKEITPIQNIAALATNDQGYRRPTFRREQQDRRYQPYPRGPAPFRRNGPPNKNCYACGRPGHLARQCPEKGKNGAPKNSVVAEGKEETGVSNPPSAQ